jgi:hypothetical protein
MEQERLEQERLEQERLEQEQEQEEVSNHSFVDANSPENFTSTF